MSSITNESFRETFGKGHGKEIELSRILRDFGWRALIDDAGSSHDIIVTIGTQIEKVEVKNEDNFAGRSENILVEYYQGDKKKASGILTSQASIWIHTLKEMVVIYRKDQMKEWLEDMNSAFPIIPISKSDNQNWGRKVSIYSLLMMGREWNDYLKLRELPTSRVWSFKE